MNKKAEIITLNVLNEVYRERKKQDSKWGEQNHPCLDQTLLNREGGCTPQRMTEEYNIPSEILAKQSCDRKANKGECTWVDITLEELSEATSTFDIHERRKEVLQLAAVAVAWVEKIDRDIQKQFTK